MLKSSVTYKLITAATGLGLTLFLLGHLAGNLMFFLGLDAINDYAKKLKSMPLLLWTARFGLLGLIVTHVTMTISLRRKNMSVARTYQKKNYRRTTLASRWMMISGSMVLAFVVIHLAHFTLQWIFVDAPNALDANGRHDVYGMISEGFRSPIVVLIYLVSMCFVMLHLKHALFSVVQTLGIGVGKRERTIRMAASVTAVVLFIGFGSIPVLVFLGLAGVSS